jgi:ribonucleoside-diphosphate reductase alpha chain
MGATAAEKSTEAQLAAATSSPATDVKFCAIDDPGCEACQ